MPIRETRCWEYDHQESFPFTEPNLLGVQAIAKVWHFPGDQLRAVWHPMVCPKSGVTKTKPAEMLLKSQSLAWAVIEIRRLACRRRKRTLAIGA